MFSVTVRRPLMRRIASVSTVSTTRAMLPSGTTATPGTKIGRSVDSVELLLAARLGVEEDVDLVVALEELVDEGAVGQGRDGKADIVGTHVQLGSAVPVGSDLDQRLIERQRPGRGVDARLSKASSA
jgi:hypothetical protein